MISSPWARTGVSVSSATRPMILCYIPVSLQMIRIVWRIPLIRPRRLLRTGLPGSGFVPSIASRARRANFSLVERCYRPDSELLVNTRTCCGRSNCAKSRNIYVNPRGHCGSPSSIRAQLSHFETWHHPFLGGDSCYQEPSKARLGGEVGRRRRTHLSDIHVRGSRDQWRLHTIWLQGDPGR